MAKRSVVSAGYAALVLAAACTGTTSKPSLPPSGSGSGGGNEPAPATRRLLEIGQNYACATDAARALWCWQLAPELSIPANRDRVQAWASRYPVGTPVRVLDKVTDVAISPLHACAVQDGGALWCWGNNTYSELGFKGPDEIDPKKLGLGSVARAGAGYHMSCALTQAGTVGCWGHFNPARDNEGVGSPTVTDKGLTGVVDLGMMMQHACAVGGDGLVRCWGENREVTLGSKTSDVVVLSPIVVPGITGAVAVRLGVDDTCVRTGDGAVWCWDGQRAPAQVTGIPPAALLDVGYGGACIVDRDGAIWCWTDKDAPSRDETVAKARSIAVGFTQRCAERADGAIACWEPGKPAQVVDLK